MSNTVIEQMPKYDSYKESGVEWLGEIPEHWSLIPNKRIFNLKKKLVGKRSSEYDLLSLTLKGIIKRDMDNPEGKFPAEFDTYQEVSSGDFVFCLFDVEETPRTVGLSRFDGMITGAYTVFNPSEQYSREFLYYFYLNLDTGKKLKPLYKGLRNTISKEAFFSFKTFVPPIDEQVKIASYLDKKTSQIDEAISIKQKQIELLKEHKQIIIQQAVTQGLNPDTPMKDSGVDWMGMIPEHWSVTRLKFYSHIQSGVTLGKVYSEEGIEEYPYLRVANVQFGYFKLDDVATIKLPKKEAKRYLLRNKDILVTEGGDIDKLGRGTVWSSEIEPCLHQNHVFAIRINESAFCHDFVANYLASDSARKHFISTATKTTNLASTNKTHLKNVYMPFPSIDEQKEINLYIAEKIQRIELAIADNENQINKLKEYKTTLINSAVTGKIKVTELA
ncbi:restriction endonuclease subunit S [Vibrio parahaemolyticus]|nr:restriction endonuclease subunit S [Vibrio parahaemolyticus]